MLDRPKSFAEKLRKLFFQWVVFIALGITAYGLGLYYGNEYRIKTLIQKMSQPQIQESDKNLTK